MNAATRFAAAYAALTAAHEVADYLVQTDRQAAHKGRPGDEGTVACAQHIASYTATQAAALYAANRRFGLGLTLPRAAAGLAVSAITHYVVDRCAGHWAETGEDAPALVRLVHASGKAGWLTRDKTAAALIDQALHKGFITLAAGVVAGRG